MLARFRTFLVVLIASTIVYASRTLSSTSSSLITVLFFNSSSERRESWRSSNSAQHRHDALAHLMRTYHYCGSMADASEIR
jgi:hypothetical protein